MIQAVATPTKEKERLRDMINKFLQRFAPGRKSTNQENKQPDRKEPRFKLGDGFYFEFGEVPNGYGGYRMINVFLLKVDDPSFRCCIVDGTGRIQNFPGIEDGQWKKDLNYPLTDKVQFAFWICDYVDGKAPVRWTLQPDGRYFEDEDGFGSEDCEEVTLYSCLDTNGKFTEPFRYR